MPSPAGKNQVTLGQRQHLLRPASQLGFSKTLAGKRWNFSWPHFRGEKKHRTVAGDIRLALLSNTDVLLAYQLLFKSVTRTLSHRY